MNSLPPAVSSGVKILLRTSVTPIFVVSKVSFFVDSSAEDQLKLLMRIYVCKLNL